jgi:hypothetical protein
MVIKVAARDPQIKSNFDLMLLSTSLAYYKKTLP